MSFFLWQDTRHIEPIAEKSFFIGDKVMLLTENDVKRFTKNIQKTNECWEWKGGKFSFGYGAFRPQHSNGNIGTHRIAYTIFKGKIPDGLFILHSCDNPSCVNPNHLRTGTQKENMQDMSDRNRHTSKGSVHGMSKLTEKIVLEIRAKYTNKRGQKAQLAREYNVSFNAITRVVENIYWTHI